LGGELSLRGITASNNSSAGVSCGGAGATVRVADALVTGNARGFWQSGGCTFRSQGNNLVDGNTTADSEGTITPLPGL
jgi:hypothetical protein